MTKYRVTKKYSFGEYVQIHNRQGYYFECESLSEAKDKMLAVFPELRRSDVDVQKWS